MGNRQVYHFTNAVILFIVVGLVFWAAYGQGTPTCVYAERGLRCVTCGATTYLGALGQGDFSVWSGPMGTGWHAAFFLVILGLFRVVSSLALVATAPTGGWLRVDAFLMIGSAIWLLVIQLLGF